MKTTNMTYELKNLLVQLAVTFHFQLQENNLYFNILISLFFPVHAMRLYKWTMLLDYSLLSRISCIYGSNHQLYTVHMSRIYLVDYNNQLCKSSPNLKMTNKDDHI